MYFVRGTGVRCDLATPTAMGDGRTWDRLGDGLDRDDLALGARALEALRYDFTATTLAPLPRSLRS